MQVTRLCCSWWMQNTKETYFRMAHFNNSTVPILTTTRYPCSLYYFIPIELNFWISFRLPLHKWLGITEPSLRSTWRTTGLLWEWLGVWTLLQARDLHCALNYQDRELQYYNQIPNLHRHMAIIKSKYFERQSSEFDFLNHPSHSSTGTVVHSWQASSWLESESNKTGYDV